MLTRTKLNSHNQRGLVTSCVGNKNALMLANQHKASKYGQLDLVASCDGTKPERSEMATATWTRSGLDKHAKRGQVTRYSGTDHEQGPSLVISGLLGSRS